MEKIIYSINTGFFFPDFYSIIITLSLTTNHDQYPSITHLTHPRLPPLWPHHHWKNKQYMNIISLYCYYIVNDCLLSCITTLPHWWDVYDITILLWIWVWLDNVDFYYDDDTKDDLFFFDDWLIVYSLLSCSGLPSIIKLTALILLLI